MALYIGLASAVGVGLMRSRQAYGLAVSAGLLWAASDTAVKGRSSHLSALGWGVLIHPLAVVVLIASLVGLLVSARSLQLGAAVPVIALTSATANLVTIMAGPIVFGEPLPHSTVGVVLRLVAFALVIAGAALMPPPLHPAGPPGARPDGRHDRSPEPNPN
jgi:multidrug transporter EmrE-like cation transporter